MLLLTACGREKASESPSGDSESVLVPVANIQELRLPVPLGYLNDYTIDENWFYFSDTHYNKDEKRGEMRIFRNVFLEEYQPEPVSYKAGVFIVNPDDGSGGKLHPIRAGRQ